MKINILRIILIILLLGIFYSIFGFSSQNSEESGGLSQKVTLFIAKKIPWITEKNEEEKEIIIDKMESVIRKLAHFSIYTVVGILIMSLLSTYKIENKRRVFISLLTGIIYAISDEIHQGFVPGRSPQITDVMIDTMGVLFGILLVMLAIKIYALIDIKRKNSSKKTLNNKNINDIIM